MRQRELDPRLLLGRFAIARVARIYPLYGVLLGAQIACTLADSGPRASSNQRRNSAMLGWSRAVRYAATRSSLLRK